MEESLALIRPGVLSSDIALAQNEIFREYGYAEFSRPPYMRSRGHGFGLGRFELVEGVDIPLEAGMSFVVHPNQYFPEEGYLALGEHVIVSEHGCERLTKTESKIYIKS